MRLNNKRILVTRPNEQANYLSSLITEQGGISVRFPTVEIQPLGKTNELAKYFNEIGNYDFVIFISRNAAKIAIEQFISDIGLISNTKIVAIGPSTAKVLSDSNLKEIIFPDNNVDSESLLNLQEMQEDKVLGKRILIIRGVGGRELLAENLKMRGANVNCVEIYKRNFPEYGEHEINGVWHDNNPDAIVVTSNDILSNLIVLLSSYKTGLLSIPLITMSNRITAHARKIGFNSEICIVDEKNDDGILRSLLEFFED